MDDKVTQAIEVLRYALLHENTGCEPWTQIEKAFQLLTGGNPRKIPTSEQLERQC